MAVSRPVGVFGPWLGSSCSAVTFPERSGRSVGSVGQAQPAPEHGPAEPEVTAGRFRAASPALAWVLGGAVLVLAAAAAVLSALAGQPARSIAAGMVIVLTFAGVGLVIARRQPGNPIGWIMIAFTLVYVLGAAANYYAVLYYRLGHRGLPLAPLSLLLSAVQAPSFAIFPVVILLFPDGRAPGCRWRWAVQAYAGLVAFVLAVILAAPAAALAGHDVHLNARGNLTGNGHLCPHGRIIRPGGAASRAPRACHGSSAGDPRRRSTLRSARQAPPGPSGR